jgi:hypothetical protein
LSVTPNSLLCDDKLDGKLIKNCHLFKAVTGPEHDRDTARP